MMHCSQHGRMSGRGVRSSRPFSKHPRGTLRGVRPPGSTPLVSGLGNCAALFDASANNRDHLHPELVKIARKSGQLNLANAALTQSKTNVVVVCWEGRGLFSCLAHPSCWLGPQKVLRPESFYGHQLRVLLITLNAVALQLQLTTDAILLSYTILLVNLYYHI